MTTPAITNLEKLLNGPRDGALLRYSLGNEYLKLGETEKAAAYFQQTVERDSGFSAAWKTLGRMEITAGSRKPWPPTNGASKSPLPRATSRLPRK